MFGWFKSKQAEEAVSDQAVEWIEENPEPLYRYFSDMTGIHFDQKKEITTLKLVRFAKEHQSRSFTHLLSMIQSDRVLFQKLVNFLTVNESYFFREIGQIHYMANEIKKSSMPIRILCAPGSTGEEPYSIAMSLSEAGIDMGRISIVSIDINTEAIEHAKEAVYSKRSLYRMDESFKERYFVLQEGKYHLKDLIKDCVKFKALNLFETDAAELGEFDYIFSRNMLIYFDPHKTALAIKKLVSLARNHATVFFFGHADIVTPPIGLNEHYVDQIKFFTKA